MTILLFDSVREILFNVVKHASVDVAHVDVRCDGGKLDIAVLDRGTGFDPEATRSAGHPSGGFGLFSIRERLGLLGGELVIESSTGKGTRALLSVPVASSPPEVPEDRGRIRVLLVDDHPVMRDGLARLFSQEPDIEVVGEASDGRTAIDLAAKLTPDVVLMDVNMSDLNGIEATRLIRERLPRVRVVGLSMLDESEIVERMLEAGASAHLSKGGPTDEIVRVVRACAHGGPCPGEPGTTLSGS
ncbi:MAG: response regulator [Candidatus Riflebacteria bacterium]|nr:response regulator [Candidatus Riflebacteria bacterium]